MRYILSSVFFVFCILISCGKNENQTDDSHLLLPNVSFMKDNDKDAFYSAECASSSYTLRFSKEKKFNLNSSITSDEEISELASIQLCSTKKFKKPQSFIGFSNCCHKEEAFYPLELELDPDDDKCFLAQNLKNTKRISFKFNTESETLSFSNY